MESEIKMDKPICLIENREGSAGTQLVVNPEAIEILSKMHKQAVVVSIAGLCRTGKSYLMNRLAGAQKGFSLGSTIQSETKGIWMWCVPHPINKDHVLIILDTEGLGDVEKGDLKNDSKIFALAVLLSSALVYNSMGKITQDALNKLELVGEITEIIKLRTNDTPDKEANYFMYFPIFIWAVRDLTLELKIDGEMVSADEYLEHALKLKTPVRSPENEQYNALRYRLRTYFRKRKCVVFDTPTDSKKELKELEQLPDDRLDENFVTMSNHFCNYIFKNAEVKKVDITVEVTGYRFGELAKLYTEALNTSVACLEEVVVSLAEKENAIAVQEATKFYEDKMKKIVLPTESLNQFLDLNRRCEEEARKVFLKRSFKDEDQKFFHEFVKNVKRIRTEFSRMNEEKSREKCQVLLKKLSVNFEKELAEGKFRTRGGHEEFKNALKIIGQKYDKEEGKGVQAVEVLKDYMKSKQDDEIIIIEEDNALCQKQKEEEVEKSKKQVEEMTEKLKKSEEELKKLESVEEKANLKEYIQRLEAEKRAKDDKINELIQEIKKYCCPLFILGSVPFEDILTECFICVYSIHTECPDEVAQTPRNASTFDIWITTIDHYDISQYFVCNTLLAVHMYGY
ncbi:guanylate-binding protein 1-like [Mantella aurantiaca]